MCISSQLNHLDEFEEFGEAAKAAPTELCDTSSTKCNVSTWVRALTGLLESRYELINNAGDSVMENGNGFFFS